MAGSQRPVRVALLSTAALDGKGSMRAYADTLLAAMACHAREIHLELVELDPAPARGPWNQRLQTLLLPLRARAQRRRAPDLWHVLDGSRAYVARALGPRPYLVTVHDLIPWLQAEGMFPGAPPLGAAARGLWRSNGLAMQRSALLACVSDSAQRDARRAFAIAPGKSVVVHHPLRPAMAIRAGQAAAAARDNGVVLHVGNNGFYKNREAVLRIFSKLDARVATRLVMAGPAPTGELLRAGHELGISNRIDWAGDPDDDALASLYRRSSVLLFPSLYEGFGWPVLEAMAFGLPVVAADSGSLPEVVGDAAACLPLADEQQFVSALEQLLASPEVARAATARGLARARQFGAEEFGVAMSRAYLMAIGNQRKLATP